MGCVSSQQKLDQFQKNSYYREDKFNQGKENNANKTISNRYAVSSPEDNEEEGEINNNVNNGNNNNNNGNELSMYTNISDFKVEKSKKKKKNKQRNAVDDRNPQDVDADMDAFKNSLKNKKKKGKKKKNLILNENSANMPGTELGVYDNQSNEAIFTGGLE